METITLDQVTAVRHRFERARHLAAERFREAFAAMPPDVPANERWRAHLAIQAEAMLECAAGVRLPDGYRIHYVIREHPHRLIIPVAIATDADPALLESEGAHLRVEHALLPYFSIDRNPESLYEYWFLLSELLGSDAWRMTTVIAKAGEYDEAIARLKAPQLVRPLFVSYLPAAEWRADETALLEVTVYSKAGEERIERRTLLLDRNHEWVFHGRELIAEGQGGVRMSS